MFFTAIGEQWDYEPEGFVIDGDPYLPDFYLRNCAIYVEIKPPSHADYGDVYRKLMRFRDEIGAIVLFNGEPGEWWPGTLFCVDSTDSSGGVSEWSCRLTSRNNQPTIAVLDDVPPDAHTLMSGHGWETLPSYYWDAAGTCTGDTEFILAVEEARSARFEHGEAPV